MQAMAKTTAQSLDTVNNKNSALIDITIVALHLALRLTTPPWRQSRSIWPNKRWLSNHTSNLGELRAAAQAASKMNGVVGSTGKNKPRNPSARLSTASPRSNHCTPRGSAAAGGAFGIEEGGNADMSNIVPCHRSLRRNTPP